MKRHISLASLVIVGLLATQQYYIQDNQSLTERKGREIRNRLKSNHEKVAPEAEHFGVMQKMIFRGNSTETHHQNMQRAKDRWSRTWTRLTKVFR